MPPPSPNRKRFEPLPASWSRNERNLWVDMADASGDETGERTTKFDVNNDKLLRAMYDTAYFNRDINQSDRLAVIDAMHAYMQSEYGLDFGDVFDWEGYRKNYDETAPNLAIRS